MRLLGKAESYLFKFSAGEKNKLLRIQDRKKDDVKSANVNLYSIWE